MNWHKYVAWIHYRERMLWLRGLYRSIFLGSYSQEKEDLLLDNIFEGKKRGFFVDVGASHPVHYNNTFRLYKKGWRGINIDADPRRQSLLNAARQEDLNLSVGIMDKRGILPFYALDEPMLSTFSKSEVDYFISQGQKIDAIINVEVFTLEDILDKYSNNRKIDLLCVDAENVDYEVLKSNNWKKYRPEVVCIEKWNPTKQCVKLLEDNGYECVGETNLNMMFKQKAL